MTINYTKEFYSKSKKQSNLQGVILKKFFGNFEYKQEGATNEDVLVLVQNLDSNAIIKSIRITSEGINELSRNDIAICKSGEIKPIDVKASYSNLLSNEINLIQPLENKNVLGNAINDFDFSKSLKDITNNDFDCFDIVMRFKTIGTNKSNIHIEIEYFDNL